MNPVAELARVPNPRNNLKSGDFSYERFTTSQYSVLCTLTRLLATVRHPPGAA